MYDETILLKCGELVLKGLNRRSFEEKLCANVRRRLGELGKFQVFSMQSTLYAVPKDDTARANMDQAVEACQRVYGIVAVCRAASCEKDMDKIKELTLSYCEGELLAASSFKVDCRRSDKSFPLTSPQIGAEVGGAILSKHSSLKVDLHEPELLINVEIRDKAAYVHAGSLPGAGGIPVGMSGKALLLLSGGIDSPVAGHMMARRGVQLTALHFESPPYTSIRAKQKVLDLANAMSPRCGSFELGIVQATHMQEEIRDKCEAELFTLIFRRMMMRVAQVIAADRECGALVTGESLGQVASQTMQSLAATDAVCDMPVFRPCIGMDKSDIVLIARQTGTFDISIEPYEDCCAIFTPKHPQTKPKLDKLERAEASLDIDALVAEAVASTEFIRIG